MTEISRNWQQYNEMTKTSAAAHRLVQKRKQTHN